MSFTDTIKLSFNNTKTLKVPLITFTEWSFYQHNPAAANPIIKSITLNEIIPNLNLNIRKINITQLGDNYCSIKYNGNYLRHLYSDWNDYNGHRQCISLKVTLSPPFNYSDVLTFIATDDGQRTTTLKVDVSIEMVSK